MKLKIKHFDASVFEKKMEHLKDIEFTLFVDDIPTSQEDLSEINVLVLQEPDEYFGLHNWAIENSHYFSFILTWDDKVLNNTDNSSFLPFGHTWFKPNDYKLKTHKEFKISHLAGKLNKTYGHGLRHMDKKEAIEDNWNRALKFVDYEQNIVNEITNIFKHNGILAL